MADDRSNEHKVTPDPAHAPGAPDPACTPGIIRTPGATLIDRSGKRRLPIGRDGWASVAQSYVLVDKTLLMADVIDSGYAATLFCRPRRFGKSLNMTMMKAFFEIPPESDPRAQSLAPLFEDTDIWTADNGKYRRYQASYPVIYLSFNTAKKLDWPQTLGEMKALIADEYRRHAYLAESPLLDSDDLAFFNCVREQTASDVDYGRSLIQLAKLLTKHHGVGVVVLVDGTHTAPVPQIWKSWLRRAWSR